MDFENVRKGVTLDKRINSSHTLVPGEDGQRVFGGTCFPKDLNALLCTFQQNQLNTCLLEAVWEYNKIIRKNADE